MASEKLRLKLDWGALAVIAVLAASVAGQLATASHLAWYARLAKPSFTPPDGIFGPVWGALYLLMAFAVWRVVWLPRKRTGRRLGLTLFATIIVFIRLDGVAAWCLMPLAVWVGIRLL